MLWLRLVKCNSISFIVYKFLTPVCVGLFFGNFVFDVFYGKHFGSVRNLLFQTLPMHWIVQVPLAPFIFDVCSEYCSPISVSIFCKPLVSKVVAQAEEDIDVFLVWPGSLQAWITRGHDGDAVWHLCHSWWPRAQEEARQLGVLTGGTRWGNSHHGSWFKQQGMVHRTAVSCQKGKEGWRGRERGEGEREIKRSVSSSLSVHCSFGLAAWLPMRARGMKRASQPFSMSRDPPSAGVSLHSLETLRFSFLGRTRNL